MSKKRKKPQKNIKPILNDGKVDAPISFDIHKTIEKDKRVKPQNVFEGYKAPKKSKQS